MIDYALKWPLQFVVDERGASTGWVIVHSRVVSPDRQQQLARLRRAGFRFVGMTSDATFPRHGDDDPIDYSVLCDAWCHCFRDPDPYLPAGVPRALISASDFTDWMHVARQAAAGRPPECRVDFVYVGAAEPWKCEAKNWELARACLPRLCGDLGLSGHIVGVPEPAGALPPSVTAYPQLPWRDLLALVRAAHFLFVPNDLDASPRVLAEALCLDVPVVVHGGILGGWKYVNPFTGVFFEGPDDVSAAVRRLRADTRPREWFRTHYGPRLSGGRLAALLQSVAGVSTGRGVVLPSDRIRAVSAGAER